MAYTFTSYILPPAGAPFWILEDIYLRGGLMVVPDEAGLATIPPPRRKAGMVAVQGDTKKWWQLADDLATWNEVTFGSDIQAVAPLELNVNQLSIQQDKVLPGGGTPGDALVYTLTGPSWGSVGSGGAGATRASAEYTVPQALTPGESFDFAVPMARTLMLLQCRVDVPCKVEAFTTIAREEANPYVFVADSTKLEDDGTSKMADGSLFYGRRFSFLSNLEEPVTSNIYWRITNTQATSATPTLSLNYLVLE